MVLQGCKKHGAGGFQQLETLIKTLQLIILRLLTLGNGECFSEYGFRSNDHLVLVSDRAQFDTEFYPCIFQSGIFNKCLCTFMCVKFEKLLVYVDKWAYHTACFH